MNKLDIEIEIDSTGHTEPLSREVRIRLISENVLVGLPMTPTFARLVASTLMQAADDIDKDGAIGQVYWRRPVVKPIRY